MRNLLSALICLIASTLFVLLPAYYLSYCRRVVCFIGQRMNPQRLISNDDVPAIVVSLLARCLSLPARCLPMNFIHTSLILQNCNLKILIYSCPLIFSLIRSPVCSFIHPFIRSIALPLARSFVCSLWRQNVKAALKIS